MLTVSQMQTVLITKAISVDVPLLNIWVRTLQVKDNAYALEQAQGVVNGLVVEFSAGLDSNLALNSSWTPGTMGQSGESSLVIPNLKLGLNIVNVRVNNVQVCN